MWQNMARVPSGRAARPTPPKPTHPNTHHFYTVDGTHTGYPLSLPICLLRRANVSYFPARLFPVTAPGPLPPLATKVISLFKSPKWQGPNSHTKLRYVYPSTHTARVVSPGFTRLPFTLIAVVESCDEGSRRMR